MHNFLHQANIVLHVTCGTLALGLGFILLVRRKGDARHRRWGDVFLILVGLVVVSATLGFVVFRPDAALGAITLLVGYQLYSGVRTIRRRGARPSRCDTLLAAIAFAAGSGFVTYLLSGHAAFWRPAITGPIAGGLIFASGYDLIRLAFSTALQRRIWTLEHGVKLIFTIGGLASAALGTIAPHFSPWSQVGPSIVFSVVALAYVGMNARAQAKVALARAR